MPGPYRPARQWTTSARAPTDIVRARRPHDEDLALARSPFLLTLTAAASLGLAILSSACGRGGVRRVADAAVQCDEGPGDDGVPASERRAPRSAGRRCRCAGPRRVDAAAPDPAVDHCRRLLLAARAPPAGPAPGLRSPAARSHRRAALPQLQHRGLPASERRVGQGRHPRHVRPLLELPEPQPDVHAPGVRLRAGPAEWPSGRHTRVPLVPAGAGLQHPVALPADRPDPQRGAQDRPIAKRVFGG